MSDPYSTERSWQDLDFSQKATLGFFFAITLSRSRLAFVGMLSLRALQPRCFRRLLTSLESLRRRSCRTMPRKASQTLCCMAADVSMNLQSNTAAQVRPSGADETVTREVKHQVAQAARITQTQTVASPLTDTSLRRTRSHLFPTRMIGVRWAGRRRRRVIRSSEARRNEARSVTEYRSRKASAVCRKCSWAHSLSLYTKRKQLGTAIGTRVSRPDAPPHLHVPRVHQSHGGRFSIHFNFPLTQFI